MNEYEDRPGPSGEIARNPLDGHVAIVTGASSGIGRAIAQKLGASGARLVLAARRTDRLRSLHAELVSQGCSSMHVALVPVDVSKDAGRDQLIMTAMKQFGRIDTLINNAGWGLRSPIEITPFSDIRAAFETNVLAPISLIQSALPIMRSQRRGNIVNISSVAGQVARPFSAVYDATKHALEAISEGLAHEVSGFGIRVIVIVPGFVRTEFVQAATARSKCNYEKEPEYFDKHRRLSAREERRRLFAVDTDCVAQVVLRALMDRHPKYKYVTPFSAQLTLALKRYLPDQLFRSIAGSS